MMNNEKGVCAAKHYELQIGIIDIIQTPLNLTEVMMLLSCLGSLLSPRTVAINTAKMLGPIQGAESWGFKAPVCLGAFRLQLHLRWSAPVTISSNRDTHFKLNYNT
jgi:hypothetical protein